MIAVKNISRSFGPKKAVDRLSFEVRPGEIFALLGPNGAGKTTTIKIILGMLYPDEGEISFENEPVTPKTQFHKSHIGYVPESGAMYETLSGREYLNFVGNLYHLDAKEVEKKSQRLLEIIDMNEAADRLIREYSKGMKQKILICSALIHEPRLIILDEPFSGLDANAVSLFKKMFREYARQGKSVIFCSHILEVVERLVDRILIIKDGRKLISGTREEILGRTGLDSLDLAFNQLTGAADIDISAREFIDALKNGNGRD